ncbi:MAG TPA: DUF4214 domain-containing protein [Iamia sp.]
MNTTRSTRPRRLTAVGLGLGLALLAALAPTAPAGAVTDREPITGLASVDRTGGAADDVALNPSVSDDGRFIAFESRADDIVGGDTNARVDIFVRDTLASTTVKITHGWSGGQQADGSSANAAISGSGRYVVFESLASNLVPLDTNGKRDVFHFDTVTGVTRRVSVSNTGHQHTFDSRNADVSDSGIQVVFEADGGLAAGDSNDRPDVYLRDIAASTTERISVNDGELGLYDGSHPAISGNGRFVAFESSDALGNQDGLQDVLIRDRAAPGWTDLVSTANGVSANNPSYAPSISEDGDVIAFETEATNLHGGGVQDTNGVRDVLVHRRSTNTTVRASVGPQGLQGSYAATGAQLDDAGTKVVFTSGSPFVNDDSNDRPDVFVRDLTNGVNVRPSVGTLGNQVFGDMLTAADISGDGRVSAFSQRVGSHPHPSIWFRGSFEQGPYGEALGLIRGLYAAFETPSTPATEGPVNSNLRNGVRSSEALIDDLAHGTFDDVRGPVIRLYWAYFERRPEQAGLDFWVAQRTGGRSLASIAQFFATSPEFQTLYGNTSNSTFVTLVYQNVLDRDPEAQGLAYWTDRLQQGLTTRGTMMIGFSESAEGRLLMRGEVDTILLHVGLLGEVPSAAAFAAGVQRLESGSGQVTEVLAHDLLVSPELAALVG